MTTPGPAADRPVAAGTTPRREGRRHAARHTLRVLVAGTLTFLVVGTVAALVVYHRQIWSYLTHRKGAPSQTEPYEPLPVAPTPLLRLAAIGDIGDSGGLLDASASAMARTGREAPYDVLLLLGDNVYPNGDPARLPETVFGPFDAILDQGTELLAILGNHDVEAGFGDAQMEALGMPARWWARDLGDVLLIGLDSTEPDDVEQREFLEKTLAGADERWRIVALHHPPYSAGYHGSNTDVREAFSPLFEQYGVQLVLSGHEHDYQRSEPIDDVTYVVSGAGSGARGTGDADFTAMSWSDVHFLDITVYRDRLLLRAVTRDVRVGDEATIRP